MDLELEEYLDNNGAIGGIIRETFTAKFYKEKYEEVMDDFKYEEVMDDFIQTIIKELGCHYMGPDMIGDEEDHKDYIITEIKKLKNDNPGYEVVEKLNKEFNELWDEKEEVKDDLLEMAKGKDFWIKEAQDVHKELKFMFCHYDYINHNRNHEETIYDLPDIDFLRCHDEPSAADPFTEEEDFTEIFLPFIDNLVKKTEHKDFDGFD